ncbi:hypothetical protein D3C81_2047110 [compost metagenome]
MNQHITATGIRCVDYGINERREVIILINPGRVLLLVHADGKKSDRIGLLAGQSPGKAVRLILMLFNHLQHLGPGLFWDIGIVVDHPGYRASGYPGELRYIFAAHIAPFSKI